MEIESNGLIHVYTGDGKGKTTAAVGQSIRTAGAGRKVLFVQFLKDGTSSEITVLKEIPVIEVDYVEEHFGFFKQMSQQEKEYAKSSYRTLYERTIQWVTKSGENFSLLVLDEILGAIQNGVISEQEVIEFLQHKPRHLEVILTGRNPSDSLLKIADYVTEMKKVKHPYDMGVYARKGIEY